MCYETHNIMECIHINYECILGPGVYEAALAYSAALKMADMATLFKLAVKQIGILRYKVMPTFMAKPNHNLPGCSGHLHFSLKHMDTGKNAFTKIVNDQTKPDPAQKFNEILENEWEDTKNVSETMKYFIAGVLTGLPSIMPLLAPTVNR